MSESTRQIRLLLIDDHVLFREGLVRLLGSEPDLEVVAHCSSVTEALQSLSTTAVDIVLLDVDLGTERGFDFLVRARREGFAGPVLVVTAGMAASEAALLISHGAAGIFLKQHSAQLLPIDNRKQPSFSISACAHARNILRQVWTILDKPAIVTNAGISPRRGFATASGAIIPDQVASSIEKLRRFQQ